MINIPTISIITPVYNTSEYLEKCIKSILNQSFKDWELILINDGSDDDSLSICNEYLKQHENIYVFSQENKGVSAARNFGLSKSKGKYLCFVDSDDWVDKDYLFNFIQIIDDYSMVVQDHKRVQNNGNEIIRNVNNFNGEVFFIPRDFDELIKEYRFTQGYLFNKIFFRQLIIDNKIIFNDKITMGEDEIFFQNYLKLIDKITYIKSDTYNYVASENSLTSKHAKFSSEFLYCLECNKFYHYLLKNNTSIQNKEYFKKMFSRNFNHLLRTVIYWGTYTKKERLMFLKMMRDSYDDSLEYLEGDTLLKKIDYFLFRAKIFRLLDVILMLKKKYN